MSERTIGRVWARGAGGVIGALVCVVVFTPWGRHAPCPVRRGVPSPAGCGGPWTNLFGWDFHGAFPLWVPIVAALIGFAIDWLTVALIQRSTRREKASALG